MGTTEDGSHAHPPQQGHYHHVPRLEVAPFVPRDARSVLDVGCSSGAFSGTLRDVLGPRVRLVGIEAVPEAAERARTMGSFDEVLTGYFPDVLPSGGEVFDLICFNDVLEHVVDPWQMLRDTRTHLAAGGHVLATIPNIQYAEVLWDLLRGRFTYQDQGVLDRTHLRFFTKSSMVDLFADAGYRVASITGVNNVVRAHPHAWRGHRRKARHLLGNAQWTQFVVVAAPVP